MSQTINWLHALPATKLWNFKVKISSNCCKYQGVNGEIITRTVHCHRNVDAIEIIAFNDCNTKTGSNWFEVKQEAFKFCFLMMGTGVYGLQYVSVNVVPSLNHKTTQDQVQNAVANDASILVMIYLYSLGSFFNFSPPIM